MSLMDMAWGEFDEAAAPVSASEKRVRKPKRGKCPLCGYQVRLRADGSPQAHPLYIGGDFLKRCGRP